MSVVLDLAARCDRPESGCWLWRSAPGIVASVDADGYPRLRVAGTWRPAAMIALEYWAGIDVIPGHRVVRECGNRRCVRPGPGHVVQMTPWQHAIRRRDRRRVGADQPALIPISI